MTNQKKRDVFGGAIASSAALAVLVLIVPLPPVAKLLILAGVAAGWTVAACRWAFGRFGRKAIVVIVTVPLVLLGLFGWAWWASKPNRELLAQFQGLRGITAGTDGAFPVGKVNYVHIGYEATDADVRKFTELDGLDGLRTLLVDGARVSDATARRFGRFTSLWALTFQGTVVGEEVLAELERELPRCRIEVREAR